MLLSVHAIFAAKGGRGPAPVNATEPSAASFGLKAAGSTPTPTPAVGTDADSLD